MNYILWLPHILPTPFKMDVFSNSSQIILIWVYHLFATETLTDNPYRQDVERQKLCPEYSCLSRKLAAGSITGCQFFIFFPNSRSHRPFLYSFKVTLFQKGQVKGKHSYFHWVVIFASKRLLGLQNHLTTTKWALSEDGQSERERKHLGPWQGQLVTDSSWHYPLFGLLVVAKHQLPTL